MTGQEPMILVPASLMQQACVLLGKIPAESAAEVYLRMLQCQAYEPNQTEDPKALK